MDNKKGMMAFVCLAAAAFLAGRESYGATYYVSPSGLDSNNGTSPATPWRTVAKVNATVFQPGDTILFERGGEWRESLVASSNGLPSSPITYDAYGSGAKPKFWGSVVLANDGFYPAGGGNYSYNLGMQADAVLEDHVFIPSSCAGGVVTVTPSSDPRTNGKLYTACVRGNVIYSNGKNHLVFRNLVVDEAAGQLADGNVQGYGIRIQGSTDVLLEDCEAHRCGRHNIGVINSTQFIGRRLNCEYAAPNVPGGNSFYVSYSDANAPVPSCTHQWIDCTADHLENGSGGKYLFFVCHGERLGSVTFINPTVRAKLSVMDNVAVTISGGTLLEDASVESFCNGIVIDGLVLKGSSAIDLYSSDGIVQNCLVDLNPTGAGPTGYSTAFLCRDGALRNTFRFNTLVTKNFLGLVIKPPGSQTRFYGNIVQTNGKVLALWDGSGTPTSTDLAQCDYNFYNSNPVFQVYWSDKDFATWKGYGFDAHSKTGDPGFNVPGTDYSLSATSQAVDAALVEPSQTPATDITGAARPAGAAPDMGCYERGASGAPTFTLTVNGGSGDGAYPAGTVVAIAADPPAAGMEFDQWIGDVSCVADIHAPTTTVTMPSANVTLTAQYRPTLAQGPSGLVGWWKLDETSGFIAEDSSGNGNNGTLENCNPPLWSSDAKYGGSLGFDGFDDRVNCGSDPSLTTATMTVAFWMKPETMQTSVPVDKLPQTLGTYGWAVKLRNDAGNEGAIWFRVGTEAGGGDTLDAYGPSNSYSAGIWQHVAATYDGTDIKLYVNGQLKATTHFPGRTLNATSTPLWFGNCSKFPPEPYKGKLDDIRLYNRALSQSEIIQVMYGGSIPVVTIVATDPTASESGPDTATFTVTASPAPISAISVAYTVTGTATPGQDFQALTGLVTIGAGETSATITVVPIDDNLPEPGPDETVVISLVAGDGYTLGSPSTASAAIVDNDSDPPGAFELISPANGMSSQTVTPLLDWQPSSGAQSYLVIVSEYQDLSSPVITEAVTDHQYSVPAGRLDYLTTYYWTVIAHNPYGDTNASGTPTPPWSFTTGEDNDPPTVVSTIPRGGARNVDIDVRITVTFSEPMEPGSTSAAFSLEGGGLPVAGTVSVDGAKLTFVPAGDLAYGTTYTIHILGGPLGASDMHGNHLAANFECSFTTAAELPGLGANVPGCSPAQGCWAGTWLIAALAALAASCRRECRP